MVLTQYELNNLLSLAKAIKEWTAWHRAAEKGKLEELRKLWEWVKVIVTAGVLMGKKHQLDVTFCILYFSSNSCSTCFGQPCAHHQELTTA